MKKLLIILGVLVCVVLAIRWYNNYVIDSDAKKAAYLDCELYQTQNQVGEYDNQVASIMKDSKIEDLKLKIKIIETKYTPSHENERFYETRKKERDKCN
jgi:peptidoglycan hydrolase CwlO-like protein